MERHCRDASWLRRCLDRLDRSRLTASLRLCLVRWFWSVVWYVSRALKGFSRRRLREFRELIRDEAAKTRTAPHHHFRRTNRSRDCNPQPPGPEGRGGCVAE